MDVLRRRGRNRQLSAAYPSIIMMAMMQRPEWFISGAEGVATAIEGIGILIVLLGGVLALVGYARDALSVPKGGSYEAA